jgi:hypothetical protein
MTLPLCDKNCHSTRTHATNRACSIRREDYRLRSSPFAFLQTNLASSNFEYILQLKI